MKPLEYRNDQISPEVDDYKLACTMAADMDGRSSPGNVVHTYAQWIATLREYYVGIGREIGEEKREPGLNI